MRSITNSTPVSISLLIVIIGVVFKLGVLVNQTEAKDLAHDNKIVKIEEDLKVLQSIHRELAEIRGELKRIRR